jgi:hypothetical protein
MRQTRNGQVKRNKVLGQQEQIAAKLAAGVVDGVDYVALRRQSSNSTYVDLVDENGMRTLVEPLTGTDQDDAARMRQLRNLGYKITKDEHNLTATIPQAWHEAQVADQHRQYTNKDHFKRELESEISSDLESPGFMDSKIPISPADFLESPGEFGPMAETF